ncbi:hypothetical protein K440DRAFT_224422 [Wilcoxina mikolae CBS 423.85]|nr:hypothetical protein K440DRAFT_224422 [Wilcoxina mikolae CBS 423.85]
MSNEAESKSHLLTVAPPRIPAIIPSVPKRLSVLCLFSQHEPTPHPSRISPHSIYAPLPTPISSLIPWPNAILNEKSGFMGWRPRSE